MYLQAEKEEFQYEKGFDSFHQLGGYYIWKEILVAHILTEAEQAVVYGTITQRQPYSRKEENGVSKDILVELNIPSYNSKSGYIQRLVGKFSSN